MSLDSLSNPFERAATLPTVMVYRGTWVSGGQYYVNDVVTSPEDGQLYMLGLTALISTVDPATPVGVSPWISFAGSATTGNPLTWRGTWSAVTDYYQGDVVIDTVVFLPFVCLATTSLNEVPSATPASWAPMNPQGAPRSGTFTQTAAGTGTTAVANTAIRATSIIYVAPTGNLTNAGPYLFSVNPVAGVGFASIADTPLGNPQPMIYYVLQF